MKTLPTCGASPKDVIFLYIPIAYYRVGKSLWQRAHATGYWPKSEDIKIPLGSQQINLMMLQEYNFFRNERRCN